MRMRSPGVCLKERRDIIVGLVVVQGENEEDAKYDDDDQEFNLRGKIRYLTENCLCGANKGLTGGCIKTTWDSDNEFSCQDCPLQYPIHLPNM